MIKIFYGVASFAVVAEASSISNLRNSHMDAVKNENFDQISRMHSVEMANNGFTAMIELNHRAGKSLTESKIFFNDKRMIYLL